MKRLLAADTTQETPPTLFTDYRQLLKEAAPELVAVATDSGSHAQVALDCIATGANVILEKPMAMSISDADRIVASARISGVKVAVCHQNRFNYAAQALYQAMRENRLGALSHAAVAIRWRRDIGYYRQAAWRGHWKSDGGALMNQCIHGIDLLRWLIGQNVTQVFGQCRNRMHPYIEAEDLGLALLTFSDGTIATLEGSTNIYPENLEETLCLFGERGTVKLGGKAAERILHWQLEDEQPRQIEEAIDSVYGNGHVRLYADMLIAITQNTQPLVSAQSARDALELVLAIYKSQKTGKPVTLPLTDFSSADMAGEFQ